MVKVLDSGFEVNEFKVQLQDYVHFQTNTTGKGISYEFNSKTDVLLQG